MEIKVKVKCISCGHKKEVKAGEVPRGEMPMCDKCSSVMIAVEATLKNNK